MKHEARIAHDVGNRCTYSNLCEPMLGSEVQIGVALLLIICITQVIGVVAKDALHKR